MSPRRTCYDHRQIKIKTTAIFSVTWLQAITLPLFFWCQQNTGTGGAIRERERERSSLLLFLFVDILHPTPQRQSHNILYLIPRLSVPPGHQRPCEESDLVTQAKEFAINMDRMTWLSHRSIERVRKERNQSQGRPVCFFLSDSQSLPLIHSHDVDTLIPPTTTTSNTPIIPPLLRLRQLLSHPGDQGQRDNTRQSSALHLLPPLRFTPITYTPNPRREDRGRK